MQGSRRKGALPQHQQRPAQDGLPWERLLGSAPRERRKTLSLPMDKALGALVEETPRIFPVPSHSRHCSLSFSTQKTPKVFFGCFSFSQQLWSRGSKAWVGLNMEHRYPSLHASKQPPLLIPPFYLPIKKLITQLQHFLQKHLHTPTRCTGLFKHQVMAALKDSPFHKKQVQSYHTRWNSRT